MSLSGDIFCRHLIRRAHKFSTSLVGVSFGEGSNLPLPAGRHEGQRGIRINSFVPFVDSSRSSCPLRHPDYQPGFLSLFDFFNMKNELLSHWQIQESLLQSYRGVFLTSQSIVFAVASILATSVSPNKPVFILLTTLGLVLLYYWYQLANARGLDVSYFQMMLMKAERNEKLESILTNFKTWQKLNADDKIRILNEFGLSQSRTRITMEIYLPALFLILWIALAIITLI
jgi:hypothetical protein